MKYSRLLLKITLLLLATTALYAQAQTGYTPLERLPGVDYESNNIGGFLQQLFTIGIGVAAFLAVIMIGIGGFEYMGGESITDKKEGRDRIVSAVLGLILILGSVLLLETINPSIISLNIGKVPLNIESAQKLPTPQPDSYFDPVTGQTYYNLTRPGVEQALKASGQTSIDSPLDMVAVRKYWENRSDLTPAERRKGISDIVTKYNDNCINIIHGTPTAKDNLYTCSK